MCIWEAAQHTIGESLIIKGSEVWSDIYPNLQLGWSTMVSDHGSLSFSLCSLLFKPSWQTLCTAVNNSGYWNKVRICPGNQSGWTVPVTDVYEQKKKLGYSLTYAWMLSYDGHPIFLTEHLVGRHVLLFWLVTRRKETMEIFNYTETYLNLRIIYFTPARSLPMHFIPDLRQPLLFWFRNNIQSYWQTSILTRSTTSDSIPRAVSTTWARGAIPLLE